MKCPVCHQSFTGTMMRRRKASQSMRNRLGESLKDGKGVIRCPHCEARLRKKISIWFIPAMIPYIISAVMTSINHKYAFLMIPSIVFFMLFYIGLPYVPYD